MACARIRCGCKAAMRPPTVLLRLNRTRVVDWTAMLLLGAYHGVNPGMGWLFAVALGMQQGSVRGVFRALLPIAVGHAGSVAMVLLVAAAVQRIVEPEVMRSASAAALIAP